MKFRSRYFFIFFLIIFLIQNDGFCKKIIQNKSELHYFTIAAGPSSGTYFPFASYVSGLLTTPPGSPPCEKGGSCGVKDLVSIAYATDGSLRNVLLLEEGNVNSAFVQSDVSLASDHIKLITPLFPELLHIIVKEKSPIYSVADLKGKMISLGKTHSGSYQTVKNIMTALGLRNNQYRFSHDDPAQACDLLQQGQVDALIMIAGSPVQCIANLAKKVSLRFVNISPLDMKALDTQSACMKPCEIAPGLYWNIGRVKTLSVMGLWVAHANANENLLYEITKAYWRDQNQNKIKLSFPDLNLLSLKESALFNPKKLHKGAYRFYKETGLITNGYEK